MVNITILKSELVNCQLPKPGDRSNFSTHKTCWWWCYNNEKKSTGQKQLLHVRTVKNKGKLILTEIFPSVQKYDI